MESFNSDRENVILINCLEGLISAEAIRDVQSNINDSGLKIEYEFHKPQIIAGVDELFAQVMVYLSPEVFSSIALGVVSSGLYDGLKTLLFFLHEQLKNKKITKIQNRKTTSIEPNVFLFVRDLRISIPIGIDDEKFKHLVDRVFEHISDSNNITSDLIKYDVIEDDFKQVKVVPNVKTTDD